MQLCIPNVLTSEELDRILTLLSDAEFIDGSTTAGWHAKSVKRNTQIKSDAVQIQDVRAIFEPAIARNRLFQTAVRPKQIGPVLVSRYEPGMHYGDHVDNAIMGGTQPLRSDVSVTLFLSSPAAYQGGELVIDSPFGEQTVKLEAGSMIAYPSSSLHRVATVTAGVRLAIVTWVQSYVREASQRELLFDLDTARQVMFEKYGKTPEFDLVSKSHANLLRSWIDL